MVNPHFAEAADRLAAARVGTANRMTVPVWLLDVDGVLNAVTSDPDPDVWPDWRVGAATAEGVRWPITFSPTVMATVARLHRSGAVEVRWLTTWAGEANGELRELLGLPELAVAGAPAAAEAWWKLPLAMAVATEGRPLIWTDDDLRYSAAALEWLETLPAALGIAPRPSVGLTAEQLGRIEEFLRANGGPA